MSTFRPTTETAFPNAKDSNPPLLEGSTCVGRQEELNHIWAAYDGQGTSHGHVMVLYGPPGVGKTCLLQEFKRQCKLKGICVLEGHCRRHGPANQPLVDIVRQGSTYISDLEPDWLGSADALKASRLVATLQARPGLVGSSGPGANNAQTDLLAAIRELLGRVSSIRPPVILVHDIHAADGATVRTLEQLLAEVACGPELTADRAEGAPFRGLFVMSFRENRAHPRFDHLPVWIGGLSHSLVRLEGLGPDGVEALLRSASVVRRFSEVTQGNPRKLEALLTWGSPDPDTALRDRFLCLSAQGRNLAMACSLLDKPCGPSVLARLTDLPAAALGSAIEELLASGIMTHSISAGELRLSFKGTADQEAVVRVAEPAHVGEWRRRVGGFFQEEGDAVAAAEHLLEAAWNHWNESQPVGTADRKSLTETVLEAGYRLEMTGSPVGATRLYQRLLDVEARYGEPLPSDGAALLDQVRERLCVLLEHCGDYERALKVAAEMTSENEAGAAHLRVGRLSLLMGDLDRATSELMLARTEAAEASAHIQEALALAELAEVELARGKHDQTSATIEHALKTCDRSSPQVLSRTQITLGKLHVERGDLDAAQRSFHQAVETAQTNNIDGEEIRALINLGITHLRKGNTEQATEHYQEALRACETDRDVRHKAFCLQNLAVLAHWQRNYKRALSLFHQAVRAFRQLGNKTHLAWLATDLGNLYLELGDSRRAESMAQLAANLAPDRGETSLGLFQTLLDGRLARERGHFLKAKHRFIKGLQMAQRMDRPDEEAAAAVELARLEWESGDHKAATELLDGIKACPTAKIKARYLLIKGQVLSETSPKEGRTALVEASELFEQVADRDGMWKTRAALAVVATSMGRAAEGRRWKHLARDCEAQLRQDVPAEFHKSYLRASHRRPFMEELTLPASEPQARPDEVSDGDSERARPEPGYHVSDDAEAGSGDGWEQTRARIVGEDSRLLKVLDATRRIAPTDSTLLIQGESGTGKELVAEACHVLSSRRDRPFVKVNCGALVETLLLSELFGHERGAFTGATRRKKGRFELAHGGTIFLDEIGDISPKTQVALLRVLQEKTFERVGGTQPIKVDVRILCATNKNLEAMVEAGTFREDLYYRLNTIQVELPPIRQRGNDVVLLAKHILDGLARQEGEALKKLTPEAEQLLLKHPWPGNVRELENVLRSCWIFCDNPEISGELMGQFLMPAGIAAPSEPVENPALQESGPAADRQTDSRAAWTPTEEGFGVIYNHIVEQNISLREFKKQMELQCIRQALSAANGNITRAATLLGMKRPRLSQLVKEHELAANAQGGNGNGTAMARKTKGE